jgi:hypothetical protein
MMRQFFRDCWNGVHSEAAGFFVTAILFHACTAVVGVDLVLKGSGIVGAMYLTVGPLYWLMYYQYNVVLKQRDQYRKELGVGKRYACEMYHQIVELNKQVKEWENDS